MILTLKYDTILEKSAYVTLQREERYHYMEKKEQLYEGKTKDLFKTDDPELLIVSYKDDSDQSGSEQEGKSANKSKINNCMTNRIYRLLEQEGIPTHYVQELSDRETVIKAVKEIPIGVSVYNVASGDFSKRLGVGEGFDLLCPTMEFHYQKEELGNPMISQFDAIAMGLLSKENMQRLIDTTWKINQKLIEYFREKDLELAACALRFGEFHGQIVAIGEFSPVTCRLWDAETYEEVEVYNRFEL